MKKVGGNYECILFPLKVSGMTFSDNDLPHPKKKQENKFYLSNFFCLYRFLNRPLKNILTVSYQGVVILQNPRPFYVSTDHQTKPYTNNQSHYSVRLCQTKRNFGRKEDGYSSLAHVSAKKKCQCHEEKKFVTGPALAQKMKHLISRIEFPSDKCGLTKNHLRASRFRFCELHTY